MAIPLPQSQAPASASRFAGDVLAGVPTDGPIDAPTGGPAASLYIHVPFCSHKCHYCDFYSIVDPRDRQSVFVERLTAELRALAPWGARPLRTIFVGGGTPSLLAPTLWERLLATLHDAFDLDAIKRGDGEFTVECNPESVTPDLLRILAAGGVNRVSLGAQSFDRAHLATLERRHNPENVARALGLARDAGIARRSIDLIYALPGQTLDQWRADLRAALALGTEHLSCYALTYEQGTAMTARMLRGEFRRADEDSEADMFEETVRILRDAGLERYEVSNFARPGAECRHNLAYWRQENWLAAGPSASGHVGGRRWKNLPRLDDYLDRSQHGFAPVTDVEWPDPRRALAERLMTALRLREGADAAAVRADAAAIEAALPARLEACARGFISRGLLTDGARWAPTESGFLVADALAVDFLRALDPA